MEEKEKILEVSHLKKYFKTGRGTLKAVDDVSFFIRKGETLGIVGESGCGKTTCGRTCIGIHNKTDGHVLYKGKDVHSLRGKERKEFTKEVQIIFQDPYSSLDPKMKVGDIIAEGLKAHHMCKSREEEQARVKELLETVGLNAEHATRYVHEFSGGQRQRIMIAIALACQPRLLIADEPTTALDVTIQADIIDLLKDIQKEFGMAVIMITHDLGIVAEICDEVSVVYAGRVIEHGTLEDIFKNTRHPYTEGLFNSLPNLENRQAELKPIKGLMPDPSNLPKGCAFCPRCEYAMEICKTQKPPRTYRNDTHYVECHLYNKDNIHEGKVNIR